MKKDYIDYKGYQACERYQSLSKSITEKSYNMVVNDTNIYQKMKNKSWLSTEKNIMKWEKTHHYKDKYEKFLSSTLMFEKFSFKRQNQQSSFVMRKCFILRLISNHPEMWGKPYKNKEIFVFRDLQVPPEI